MTSLITFSGLDGAGKTTQISLFVEHLERQTTAFSLLTMYDDISVAARVRRFFEKPRAPAGPTPNRGEEPAASAGGREPTADLRLDKNRSDLPTVVARELVYLLDLVHFLYIRRRASRNPSGILVMDRYFYDSLANLLSATKLSAPYVSLFLKLAPAPEVAVLLDLEPETAFRRKREYPLEYLRRRRVAYQSIFSQVDTALIVDAEQEPERAHRQIVERAEGTMSLFRRGE